MREDTPPGRLLGELTGDTLEISRWDWPHTQVRGQQAQNLYGNDGSCVFPEPGEFVQSGTG